MKRIWYSLLVAAFLLFSGIPVRAADYSSQYIWDMARIMSDDEAADLQKTAAAIARQHQCGCYVVTVEDYRDYSSASPYEAAKAIYRDMNFGYGSGKDGELLMLSMDDRDFAIIAYGDYGNRVFTDYGKEKLDEVYLDNFRNNDWYGGFSDYLKQSEKYLQFAEEGTYFDVDTDPERISEERTMALLLHLVIGVVVASIFSFIAVHSMKTAVEAGHANVYTVPGSARITGRQDIFERRTRSVRHIERSHSSGGGGGGTHVDSGGFSGHSGKF